MMRVLVFGQTGQVATELARQAGDDIAMTCLGRDRADLAAALITMARAFHADRGTTGTYHFSDTPDVSWADFARDIFAQTSLTCTVEDIPTSAYPTPARRPANSRVDCTALTLAYGIERPDWRASWPVY